MSLADDAVRAVTKLDEELTAYRQENQELAYQKRIAEEETASKEKQLENLSPGCEVCSGPYPGPAMREHLAKMGVATVEINHDLWDAWQDGCCSVTCRKRLDNPEEGR